MRSLLILLALCLVPRAVSAQGNESQLQRAKALFKEGNALLAAGDPERALERFLQSREALPSGKNTANAAICLERLGREDEALEMYEELLARFSADLDQQDRESLAPIMARLRAGLGSLELSANVAGNVTVDGRPRGTLPRVTALRVRPGKRHIRVMKEGYQSFDGVVEVEAARVVALDAVLTPLSGTGALRVELGGSAATTLFIDGKAAGALPWEGTLSVGTHVVQAVGASVGSVPEAAQVIERKTLLVRLNARPLGRALSVLVEPKTARLSLAGAPLGTGAWRGRLPLGSYQLTAEEPGYFTTQGEVAIGPADGSTPLGLRLVLRRDPKHPRWPRDTPWRFGAAVSGAFTYAPQLNGEHESCAGGCSGSVAAPGGRFEAVLEALHDRGLGVELGLGYWLARQTFTGATLRSSRDALVTYALERELAMGGAHARIAGFALQRLFAGYALRSSLGFGVSRMVYDASAFGIAWTTAAPVAAGSSGYEPLVELMPFVTTGLALERSFGPFHAALGVAAWFVPIWGPRFPDVALTVTYDCDGSSRSAIGCAAGWDRLAQERVHGPFVVPSLELSAGYRF